MQKRLMAAAVASALAVPGIALAQSTVQIYGQAEIEQAYLDQGSGRPNTDYFESTGSYLGFKGTEALGGGISGWFQCETTMDVRGIDQTGLCSRNSGLGLSGGFGNVWAGRWHTPMSRAISLGDVGTEATGNFGLSQITAGGSGSTSIMRNSTGYDTGNNGSSENRTRFRRRETCLTTYETPNMSGFMVGAAVSCGNKASEADASNQSNDKPRVWSVAGTYNNGPLALGAAYEKHVNVGAYANGAKELDDRGWALSARYRFGPVTLGAHYVDRKWDNLDGDVKVKAGQVGFNWNIAGPHALEGAFAYADDAKGDSAFGVGTGGGEASSAQGAGGGYSAATNPIAAPGSSTGTKGYTLGYVYSFSKRTSVKLAYTYVDNDKNTDGAQLFTSSSVDKPGENQSALGVIVKHRF